MGRSLLFVCLALLLVVSPAPAGFVNLITNGDFEAGNTGFITQYLLSPGDIGPAQTYDIVNNPAHDRPHDISPISYGGHTTDATLQAWYMASSGRPALSGPTFWRLPSVSFPGTHGIGHGSIGQTTG
jgi:hypothetical protein